MDLDRLKRTRQTALGTEEQPTPPRWQTQTCLRRPVSVRTRNVSVVYTDLFLNTFNYDRDIDTFWTDLLEMEDVDDRIVLVVLSQPVFDVIKRNENAVVLRGGKCFITTPKSFDRIGDKENRPPATFDAIVYFNVDPFMHARYIQPTDATPEQSTLADIVRTPFVATFDYYMTSPKAIDTTSVSLIFSVLLLQTECVGEYERSRDVVLHFSSRVFSIHSYEQEVVRAAACNFCSNAVLCAAQDMQVYTVLPDQQVPSLRSLGPKVSETMFHANRLVLLDVSSPVAGGQDAEYYRLKQFYVSLAHGHKNKWGLTLAPGTPLRAYIERWNLLLREELKRWFWVLRREVAAMPVDERPSDDELQQRVVQVYNMCPCILNAVKAERDVRGRTPVPLVTTNSTISAPNTVDFSERYISDVLMKKYDTSSFAPGGDLTNRLVMKSLLSKSVSINDMLLVERTWPASTTQIKHNIFFNTITS